MTFPKVMIIIGSKSDADTCMPIQNYLLEFGIESEFHISSAHRNPAKTLGLVKSAEETGVSVLIACAGMAAHLPGVIASHTILPVIGVPLKGNSLNGEDALYSVVQMPPGVPVATVAINGTKNAAILAAQIIALTNSEVREKLLLFKHNLTID